jgi:hypothetical protein
LFESNDFEIWPENVDALSMFMRCQTQWRSGPNGLIGLDYGVVLELCRLYDVGNKKALLEDLQIMEAEALRLIVEEAERQQKAAKRKRSR